MRCSDIRILEMKSCGVTLAVVRVADTLRKNTTFYSKGEEYKFYSDAVRVPYRLDPSKRKSKWAWGKHGKDAKSYSPHPEG
ncbi:MAG: hypothetical protein NZ560_03675, partial [Aquificaceae bacterium]|nr:hypothetical protein [Aquificaceae bacterium]